MVKLEVSLEGKNLESRDLEPGEYSVGRLPENDVVLDHHKVSRRHCRILVGPDEVVVEDAGSTNGVLVDGQRVAQVKAAPGQVVTVEPYELKFQFELAVPAGDEGSDRTILMNASATPEGGTVIMKEPPVILQVREGNGATRQIELPPGVTVMGRSQECDVIFEDPAVSRRHAEFEVSPGGVMLRDLNSSGGTKVDGKDIQSVQLKPGDKVTMGAVELVWGAEAGVGTEPAVRKLTPKKAKDPGASKRRLMLIAAAVILLLAVGAIVVKKSRKSSPTPPAPTVAQELAQEQTKAEEAEKRRRLAVNLDKARQAMAQQQYQQAMTFLNIALAIEPDNPEATNLRKQAQDQLTRQEAIQRQQEEERKARMMAVQRLQAQAQEALNNRNYDQALSLAQQLTGLDPNNAVGHQVARSAEAAKAEESRQRQAALAASKERETKAAKLYEQGVSSQKAGRLTQAVAAWEKVLQVDPQGVTPQADKARKALAEAKGRLTKQADALYRKGQSQAKSGHPASAMDSYEKALRVAPWHAASRKAMAELADHNRSVVKRLMDEALVLESLGDIKAAVAKWKRAEGLVSPSSATHKEIKAKLDQYGR